MWKEIEEFLRYHASLGRSERTLYHYRRRLKYFYDSLGKKNSRTIRNVTIEHIREYHEQLIDKNMGISTRYSYLHTVQAIFRWLHDRGKLLSDIAEQIELPRLDRSLPPRVLTDEEVSVILGSIQTETLMGKRDYAIVQLLYACGLRRNELIGLNFGDIDAEAKMVFVRGKGNKERVVPIHDTALQAVQQYVEALEKGPKKGEPLFVTCTTLRIHGQVMQKLFDDLSQSLTRHVYPHLLRHTYAVHLLKGGADVRHVQLLLGHESPDTTSRYLGLVKDDLKREYDRALENMFGD